VKRQELLRQLDQEAERLKAQADDLARRIKEFKEEEKQRVPKWGRCPTSANSYVTANKWYRVVDSEGSLLHIIDNDGDRIIILRPPMSSPHSGSVWEISYDENCPQEKQRVPKWVMYPKKTSSKYLTPGKWYRVENSAGGGNDMSVTITTENGNKSYTNLKGSAHIDHGDWEVCYSDNPPEEKKVEKTHILEEDEPMQDKDMVVDANGHTWFLGDYWVVKLTRIFPSSICASFVRERNRYHV
jgi:hypothetical protein